MMRAYKYVQITPKIQRRLEYLKRIVVGRGIKLHRCNRTIPSFGNIISCALDLLEEEFRTDSEAEYENSPEGKLELYLLTLEMEKALKEMNWHGPISQKDEARKDALKKFRGEI